MALRFVVPPLDGPITGGTRFNRELINALQLTGVSVDVHQEFETGWSGVTWVDTLFLDHVKTWSRLGAVGLLTHYLPSLVSLGAGVELSGLSSAERSALELASWFAVPSEFLATELERLGVDRDRIGVVEPGVDAAAVTQPLVASAKLRATVVANITPGKRIAPLLSALANESMDQLELRIVGSADADPDYAAACRSLADKLSFRVVFEGMLPHDACLDVISRSDLLLSPSKMESFGMAIADAQACGVPVIGCEGGNVRALISRGRGGEVVCSVRDLAAALAGLIAEPHRLKQRILAARAAARRRPWDVAAREFAAFNDATTSRRTSDRMTR